MKNSLHNSLDINEPNMSTDNDVNNEGSSLLEIVEQKSDEKISDY